MIVSCGRSGWRFTSSANELPRAYLVMAMADEGRLTIDTGVARWGTTADVSPSGGHHYSNKAPGSSMLAVPAYVALRGVTHATAVREPTLGEMMWTFRVWTGVVPTLLFCVLLAGFLRRFTDDAEAPRAAVAIYAIGSMAVVYSILFISHQLSAVYRTSRPLLPGQSCATAGTNICDRTGGRCRSTPATAKDRPDH
jgi:hypothetical protein